MVIVVVIVSVMLIVIVSACNAISCADVFERREEKMSSLFINWLCIRATLDSRAGQLTSYKNYITDAWDMLGPNIALVESCWNHQCIKKIFCCLYR